MNVITRTGERCCTSTAGVISVDRTGLCAPAEDRVLDESRLDVYLGDALAMQIACTPVNVKELVIGRLYSERYISDAGDVRSVEFDGDRAVRVVLAAGGPLSKIVVVEDVSTVGSASRILRRAAGSVPSLLEPRAPAQWESKVVFGLCDRFAQDTPLHSTTSGTHSCRLALDGEIVFTAEDIGRHNALDKVIGHAVLNGIDLSKAVVFSSGRIPVDMAVKAIRANVAVLATKAAPTDQAIRLAREYGLTLVRLTKDGKLLVYAGLAPSDSSREVANVAS